MDTLENGQQSAQQPVQQTVIVQQEPQKSRTASVQQALSCRLWHCSCAGFLYLTGFSGCWDSSSPPSAYSVYHADWPLPVCASACWDSSSSSYSSARWLRLWRHPESFFLLHSGQVGLHTGLTGLPDSHSHLTPTFTMRRIFTLFMLLSLSLSFAFAQGKPFKGFWEKTQRTNTTPCTLISTGSH